MLSWKWGYARRGRRPTLTGRFSDRGFSETIFSQRLDITFDGIAGVCSSSSSSSSRRRPQRRENQMYAVITGLPVGVNDRGAALTC
jgi:hypothetical protein